MLHLRCCQAGRVVDRRRRGVDWRLCHVDTAAATGSPALVCHCSRRLHLCVLMGSLGYLQNIEKVTCKSEQLVLGLNIFLYFTEQVIKSILCWSSHKFCLLSFLKFWFKYHSEQKYQAPQVRHNSNVFWKHTWWRALCTAFSEVDRSAFIYRLFHEDCSSIVGTNTLLYTDCMWSDNWGEIFMKQSVNECI